MLLNDVRVSNEYPDIRFNISRTHFIREEQNHLQLWDVRKKRKLLQMSFHNEINAFPDITGKRVLVVEDNDKESSEFTLHVLSHEEGRIGYGCRVS
jgi:hypothetical protein